MMEYQRLEHLLCSMLFVGSDGTIIMRIIVQKNLKEWIKKCEGFASHIYLDTVQKWTIGYGRNLHDNGITREEADYLFDNDFNRCVQELEKYSWYLKQPEAARSALINMCFNMGITKLLGFKKMINALENGNRTLAAQEALNSLWASQVGQRAKDVAVMIRE